MLYYYIIDMPSNNTLYIIYVILILISLYTTYTITIRSKNGTMIFLYFIMPIIVIALLLLTSSFSYLDKIKFTPNDSTNLILTIYPIIVVLLLFIQNNMNDFVSQLNQQETVTNINFLILSLVLNVSAITGILLIMK